MFCMSYRLMARASLRKGSIKMAKPLKVQPIKASAAQTAAAGSILNGPLAPPLKMEAPKIPSLDMTFSTQAASDAIKRKSLTIKKATNKPAKKTAKVSSTSNRKDHKVPEKATQKKKVRKPTKLVKRHAAGKTKIPQASQKRSVSAKANPAKTVKRK